MKVICIDASQLAKPVLKEGNTYTVYNENNYLFNKPVYFLEEVDADGDLHPFDKDRFVPTGDLDETKLVTEEFEEKYCVPVKSNVCKSCV